MAGLNTLESIHKYLLKQGKIVSMSKLKKDSAKGLLKRTGTTWKKEDIEAYADTLPVSEIPAESGNLLEQKTKEEILKIRAQRLGIERENAIKEGKLFRKQDVWLELAHRASVMYSGLRQSLLAAVPAICRAGLSDPTNMEEVLRAEIENAIDEGINAFSRPMSLEVETWSDELELEEEATDNDD